MSDARGEVLAWLAADRVASGCELASLRAAGVAPTPTQWRAFLGGLALWLGTAALAAAVVFFFAFNWDALGRLAKLGLAEAAIIAGLIALWPLGVDRTAGKAVLTLVSLLVGALLALIGQIYQTGADTYELFAFWAALILPWALIGRFASLWLVWLALLNLAAFTYHSLDRDAEPLLWSALALNGLALIAWEAGHRACFSWLSEGWPPRLVALAVSAAATALAVWAVVGDPKRYDAAAVLAYLGWLAATYAWYRRVRPDLFMLAAGVLSLIMVLAVFLAVRVLGSDGGSFLLVGLAVIGASAAGAMWLGSVAREHGA